MIKGKGIRSQAWAVYEAISQRVEHVHWVQGVVVAWGEFTQGREEADKVVYIRGHDLVSWLNDLPARLNGPQRAAIVAALRQERMVSSLASS